MQIHLHMINMLMLSRHLQWQDSTETLRSKQKNTYEEDKMDLNDDDGRIFDKYTVDGKRIVSKLPFCYLGNVLWNISTLDSKEMILLGQEGSR